MADAEHWQEEEFYLRYYVDHTAKLQGQQGSAAGHTFLEFELRSDGLLRYTSCQGGAPMMRKELYVSGLVARELRHILDESEIMKCACARPRLAHADAADTRPRLSPQLGGRAGC